MSKLGTGSVASNTIQLSQLITRLWERTQGGAVSWEQLSEGNKYQARMGDFVIFVWGTAMSGLVPNQVSIEVKRLNGRQVSQANIGGLNVLLGTDLTGGQQTLTPSAAQDLHALFKYLSDRSPDLDELLRVLG